MIGGKSEQILRLRECFAFAPLRMTEFLKGAFAQIPPFSGGMVNEEGEIFS